MKIERALLVPLTVLCLSCSCAERSKDTSNQADQKYVRISPIRSFLWWYFNEDGKARDVEQVKLSLTSAGHVYFECMRPKLISCLVFSSEIDRLNEALAQTERWGRVSKEQHLETDKIAFTSLGFEANAGLQILFLAHTGGTIWNNQVTLRDGETEVTFLLKDTDSHELILALVDGYNKTAKDLENRESVAALLK